MSKYEELSRLGTKHSADFFRMKLECRLAAQRLMSKLAAYLECPPINMIYYLVTYDLQRESMLHPIAHGIPEVTHSKDGFWYFGVQFKFNAASEYAFTDMFSVFGIKLSGSKLLVRYEKDFEIDPEDESDLKVFFDYLYNDYIDEMMKPIDKPNKRIGFHGSDEEGIASQ